MSTAEWPRLSETLEGPRDPLACQSCGTRRVVRRLGRWQEHDQDDRPEPIAVVLCEDCSARLIDPHPRLYRRLQLNEPFPGTMRVCWDCPLREGVRCRSPQLRSNGGPGIRFPAPDSTIHIDGVRNGRRFGEWLKGWSKEPDRCEGKPSSDVA